MLIDTLKLNISLILCGNIKFMIGGVGFDIYRMVVPFCMLLLLQKLDNKLKEQSKTMPTIRCNKE